MGGRLCAAGPGHYSFDGKAGQPAAYLCRGRDGAVALVCRNGHHSLWPCSHYPNPRLCGGYRWGGVGWDYYCLYHHRHSFDGNWRWRATPRPQTTWGNWRQTPGQAVCLDWVYLDPPGDWLY